MEIFASRKTFLKLAGEIAVDLLVRFFFSEVKSDGEGKVGFDKSCWHHGYLFEKSMKVLKVMRRCLENGGVQNFLSWILGSLWHFLKHVRCLYTPFWQQFVLALLNGEVQEPHTVDGRNPAPGCVKPCK